jgi:DNA transformation protein and related proteins
VSLSAEFRDFLIDQMAGFGPVTMRRMFGGAGVYRNGLMFALVDDDVLYLKTDDAGSAAFKIEGLAPFSYATKSGEHTLTSYWRAPERCLEDSAEMAEWCRLAYAVALAKSRKKRSAAR